MENTCRICWKKIWTKYTDKRLWCNSCREEINKAIWYDKLHIVNWRRMDTYTTALQISYDNAMEDLSKEKQDKEFYYKKCLEQCDEIEKLKEENKELRKDAEDIAMYSMKLIEEIKRLKGLQICWKTVAEWIEEDREVVRVDKDWKVVSWGEFRELC